MVINKISLRGGYGRLTGHVVSKIIEHIKKSKHDEDSYGLKYKEDIVSIYDSPLSFIVCLKYRRKKLDNMLFSYDGETLLYGDKLSIIQIKLTINPQHEPESYSNIVSILQDTVRHEIEHLTQEGENKKKGKPPPTPAIFRKLLSNNKKMFYYYFILPDEIPAMVHGLYRKAKHDKLPLEEVINDYLVVFINRGVINYYQKNMIEKFWIKFIKNNLNIKIKENNRV